MYCPECGAENDASNRYCVHCGAPLARAERDSTRPSGRERLRQLVGDTPRARMLSVATLIAIVVAIGAFVLIDPASEGSGQDAFTRTADRECARQKLRIAALEG